MENGNPDIAELQSKEQKPKNQSSWSVQDYLSIGYLYLLILGMGSDSLYYGLLGINIASYSSILDVLLSPIISLGKGGGFILVFFLFIAPAIAFGVVWLARWRHNQSKKKKKAPKKPGSKNLQINMDGIFNSKQGMLKVWLGYTAFMIFCGYLGLGLGGGSKISDLMKSGEFRTDCNLTFIDGDKKEVRLVGHNSQYIFYIEEDSNFVAIAPIPGNVKIIEEF